VLGVEDVFSTWLYTGNSSTQTITNGIDLAGEGGMVWIKSRTSADIHCVYDTERGGEWRLGTNLTIAQNNSTDQVSFQSTGFTAGINSAGNTNDSSNNYASWTFRKAEKFFDVVTYTGTSSAQSIAHNLGSVPGFVIVKRLDTASTWRCWHRSLPSADNVINLNENSAYETNAAIWNGTAPTSTHFTVGTNSNTNTSGGTYVAYLFAHDAGGFGDDGTESVIKCGSYTGNGTTTGPVIDLGWEPQWVLIKYAAGGSFGSWNLVDNMRGWANVPSGNSNSQLYAQLSNAEDTLRSVILLNNGFQPVVNNLNFNSSGATYIYIAIRRGPMKTPTDATEVFATAIGNNTGSQPAFTSGFPVDFAIWGKDTTGATFNRAYSRLTGGYMVTASNDIEVARLGAFSFMEGWYDSSSNFTLANSWMFRRAPGYFDVSRYLGTGSAKAVPHNLGVAPELIIVKGNLSGADWPVYHFALGNSKAVYVNFIDSASTSSTFWNNTSPTETHFTVGSNYHTNNSGGSTYVAYLFATCPGVSKVGSYTGTGTTLNVDCGFTAGARFVLIKRTDVSIVSAPFSSWYVWDTARGITSGNDPYLQLNLTAAEVTSTDYIDPLSSGFQISSTAPAAINANGGSFIFLAIA